MIAIAKNDSSIFGLRINQSSFVGGRSVKVIASFGQFLMQLAHKVQLALDSIVRGNENKGQAGALSVPLKQAAFEEHV
jgi:hypothetical protein